MKIKSFIFLMLMLLLCSCTKVDDQSIEDITSKLSSPITETNKMHTGYKYYVPKGMQVEEYMLYNDIISSDSYNYYLYVDLVSYYNKKVVNYEENNQSYYSKSINTDNKFGYVEINLQENNQYLIEIMFNYAKIEVMVEQDDINLALNYAVSILRSVEYNDSVIANLFGEDVLTFQEEDYNIFNTTSSDSNYLKFKSVEEDQYIEESKKDTDLLN